MPEPGGWQAAHAAELERRLAWLRVQPDGTLHEAAEGAHRIRIIKQAGQVQLYFVDPPDQLNGPMSRMQLDRPLRLLAEYTQAAALTLLWQPEPARAALLGLAGGRLSLVLYHHLPALTIDNVEVDPAVPPLAERFFGLAFDGRQRLAVQDARAFLEGRAGQRYDIIVMDAFSDAGDQLDHLATVEFYALCQARLARGGVVCVNLLKSDPRFLSKARTFLHGFRHASVAEQKHGVVLFGSQQGRLSPADLLLRARRLDRLHQFDFPFVERAATLRHARDNDLLRGAALRTAPLLKET